MKVYDKKENKVIDIKQEHLALMLHLYPKQLEIYDEKKHCIEEVKETKKDKKDKKNKGVEND